MTDEAAPTVASMLDEAARRLRDADVPDPRRDAGNLMAVVLRTDRGGVVARRPEPVAPEDAARFDALIAARARRTPLQYLEGQAEFRGMVFEVNGAVLIPRPETEKLVQAVLDDVIADPALVADLGTGSGCIAVSLAVARRSWRLVAVDRSAGALDVAAKNASRHGVTDRLQLVERDFGTVPDGERGRYDAVVSNPPYVPEDEWRGLQPEVRDHEPRLALVPGPTGNEAYAVVARSAASMLRPGGLVALELGWKSEHTVRSILSAEGFVDIAVRPDENGIPRVATAHR